MKRQLGEKKLKNKYTDSSLLFRLPSHPSQPRVLETKSSIQSGVLAVLRGRTGRQLSAKPGSGGVQEGQDQTAMLLGFC